VRLAKRYRFSASHRLHSPALSDEENQQLYGKCNNPYGHGHDYVLEVAVSGTPDEATGLLVPIPRLDELVRRTVLQEYDHKYLNAEIPVFEQVVPTTENVTEDIFRRLKEAWPPDLSERTRLDSIRIWETRRNIVEVGGE
jgi:6-pyruvoyltetrahydropterin/6-carboxytetrahydropterin synthase